MELPIAFTKMSGTGNDFIIIDNRLQSIRKDEMADLARRICRRQFSVGADGLIMIEKSDDADFQWQFYNADGSEAEMCGNGARCAARYAFSRGIAPERMTFRTLAGLIEAQIIGSSVKIRLTLPSHIRLGQAIEVAGREIEIHTINTGVPHAVSFVTDNKETPVKEWGRIIRHHKLFEPAGTNVNFVQLPDKELYVRTYERGVENETLACGTGAVASALIAALHGHVTSPVTVRTSGNEKLIIHFSLIATSSEKDEHHEQRISEVFLEGPASFIYEGSLHKEAL
ncbi:MAG: diaminopimelate epimerase [Proteobacteria bacterium]|nr:diaminopimelate epimerase [Pseudomonadota bacterium]MBU1687001.1 diaminopimelate epimerase [Pseudomonadota bacterium]